MNEPKYGPTDDGAYNTKYLTTIVYDSENSFETAVAFLADQAQIFVGRHYDYKFSPLEHPSPTVILFGDWPTELAMEFINAGCNQVAIFLPEKPTGFEAGPSNSIVYCDLETIHDYLRLIPSPSAIYALEHITCAIFPNYKSRMGDQITAAAGKNMLLSMRLNNSQPLGVTLLKTCSGFRGFETIHSFIATGATTNQVYANIGEWNVSEGHRFQYKHRPEVVYIDGAPVTDPPVTEFSAISVESIRCMEETIAAAAKKGIQLVVFYRLETRAKPSWSVWFKSTPATSWVLDKYTSIDFGSNKFNEAIGI